MRRNLTDTEKCVWHAMICIEEKEKYINLFKYECLKYTHACVCVLDLNMHMLSSGNKNKKLERVITYPRCGLI